MVYQNMYIFVDSENENKGVMIYTEPSIGLKKSVWNIEQSDLDNAISVIGNDIVEIDKRAKLGKEKAIRVIVKEDDYYIETYVLASNKYIYIVGFISDNLSDLENSDYEMIKSSFKLKDKTTNPIAIYMLIIIAIIAIRVFFMCRKNKNRYSSYSYSQNNEIDYKNMTEEDFNKMDE